MNDQHTKRYVQDHLPASYVRSAVDDDGFTYYWIEYEGIQVGFEHHRHYTTGAAWYAAKTYLARRVNALGTLRAVALHQVDF